MTMLQLLHDLMGSDEVIAVHLYESGDTGEKFEFAGTQVPEWWSDLDPTPTWRSTQLTPHCETPVFGWISDYSPDALTAWEFYG